MGSVVYVWPLHLLGVMYADLHGQEEGIVGFELLHSAVAEDGTPGDKISIIFDFPSPRSISGHINVAVSGDRFSGGGDAERSAVLAMVESLRTEYGLFPADYSFVLISQKRELYHSMRTCLGFYRSKFDEMDGIIEECHNLVEGLCQKLAHWTRRVHLDLELADIVSVTAYHVSLSDRFTQDAKDAEHARQLVKLLMHRDVEPEALRRFQRTIPMPMFVDWEGSYFILCTIYNVAITKFNCEFSAINVVSVGDGRFKATVNLGADLYVFWGPSASSEKSAKAKLLFTVIKHVNTRLGYAIIDLRYLVRLQLDIYIQRFDHKMDGIHRCGLKLRELMDACQDAFARDTVEVLSKLAVSQSSESVILSIQELSSKMNDIKARFNGSWGFFENAKVTEQTLRARLRQNA